MKTFFIATEQPRSFFWCCFQRFGRISLSHLKIFRWFWTYWKKIFVLNFVWISMAYDFNRIVSKIFMLNPFVPNPPFFYPQRISKNLTVFWSFQGVEKGCIENERVKRCSSDALNLSSNFRVEWKAFENDPRVFLLNR